MSTEDDPVKKAEQLLQQQPPIDPSSFWADKAAALPSKVAAYAGAKLAAEFAVSTEDDPVKKAEQLLQQQPPIDPSVLRESLERIASKMMRHQTTALDEGCAALLRAGVSVHDLEIVHEIGQPRTADDGFIVHQRVYVRARPAAADEAIRADERERIAELVETFQCPFAWEDEGEERARCVGWLQNGAKG